MSGIYLLLGTNLGEKAHNLQVAKEFLTARAVIVKKESKIYETAAWGLEAQPSFFNQVVEVDCPFTAQKLLEVINDIEVNMGRKRFEKWGERLIDIDILYFGDLVINQEDLKVPHTELHNRRFTLVPLVEINAQFVNPLLNKTNAELLEICPDHLQVEVLNNPYL